MSAIPEEFVQKTSERSADVPQPFPLHGNRLVHAPPRLLFDHLELRPHAVPPGLPLDLEFALAGRA